MDNIYKLYNIKLVGGASPNLCINGIDSDTCNSDKCIWNSLDNVCYPEKYMDSKSTLSSKSKREAYKKSYNRHLISILMAAAEEERIVAEKAAAEEERINEEQEQNQEQEQEQEEQEEEQVEEKAAAEKTVAASYKLIRLQDNLYLKFIKHIGTGSFGEIYDIKLYDSTMNEIKYDTDICVKVSNLQTDDEKQKDEKEFVIGSLFGDEKIGPKMYHHFIIDEPTIKSKIVDYINNINKETRLRSTTKYLSFIIMQKLDGYPLRNTTYYFKRENPLTLEQRNQFCDKIDRMHSLGYIHNDLHQDNIFIDKQEPYIIDFGLTEHIDNFKPYPSKSRPGQYYKTLGNLFSDPSDTYTRMNQFCKKADWSCERGNQSENTYLICKDEPRPTSISLNKIKDSISSRKAKLNLIKNNQSGYM